MNARKFVAWMSLERGVLVITAALIVVGIFYIGWNRAETTRVHALHTGGDAIRPMVPGDHVIGTRGAPLTIFVYSDPECPYCKIFYTQTMPKLLAEFPGKILFDYRYFLLSQFTRSPHEAEAEECAAIVGGEDAYWKYVSALYAATPSENGLDPAVLPQLAAKVGLSSTAFASCLSTHAGAERVLADRTESTAASFNVTPTFVFRMPGATSLVVTGSAYQHMYQAIKAALSTPVAGR